MNFTALINRQQLEKVARELGYKNVGTMAYITLAAIAEEATAKMREEYKQVRDNKVPHSNILVDNLDANAVTLHLCDYCGGEGRVEEILANSPYSAVVDCEVCSGMGELEMMHTVALREAA